MSARLDNANADLVAHAEDAIADELELAEEQVAAIGQDGLVDAANSITIKPARLEQTLEAELEGLWEEGRRQVRAEVRAQEKAGFRKLSEPFGRIFAQPLTRKSALDRVSAVIPVVSPEVVEPKWLQGSGALRPEVESEELQHDEELAKGAAQEYFAGVYDHLEEIGRVGRVTRSQNMAQAIVNAANRAARASALQWASTGIAPTGPGYDILGAVRAEASRAALGAVSSSFSAGRDAEQVRLASQISYSIYSTMLDANTCEECESKNGLRGPAGGRPELPTPNPNCYGGAACRCMWIPVVGTPPTVDDFGGDPSAPMGGLELEPPEGATASAPIIIDEVFEAVTQPKSVVGESAIGPMNVNWGPPDPRLTEEIGQTLDDIEKVHSLPPGAPMVKFANGTAGPSNAIYMPSEGVLMANPLRETYQMAPQYVLAHEIGHYIDLSVLDTAAARASTMGLGPLAGVMKAIHASPTWRGLPDPSSIMGGYLRSSSETFARAYAQYIATRSGISNEMVKAFRNYRARNPNQVWKDDEFGPIASAFDKLFREDLKWH